MCKYNSHYYWENMLIHKKDIWNSYFMNAHKKKNSIFINTTIIDYKRNVLDNNWACYPDMKSILGFLQYIYLPTAFYYILNKDLENIITPICSSEELIGYIQEKNVNTYDLQIMEEMIKELRLYWDVEEEACKNKIKKFCKKFNSIWNDKENVLYMNIFFQPIEILDHILKDCEFIEVIEEEIEMSQQELYHIYGNMHNSIFMKKNFMNFLQNKIGCIA
ncbi:hypothetical protein [Inediibacterium massiliense]|uniref:hypothetical protein n=1 Tax=Inediibacterium massiliense TaxID=1658111 RepID=UPI0006B64FA7|nr:hypothetical protein [Inediibacterium massiliense]